MKNSGRVLIYRRFGGFMKNLYTAHSPSGYGIYHLSIMRKACNPMVKSLMDYPPISCSNNYARQIERNLYSLSTEAHTVASLCSVNISSFHTFVRCFECNGLGGFENFTCTASATDTSTGIFTTRKPFEV